MSYSTSNAAGGRPLSSIPVKRPRPGADSTTGSATGSDLSGASSGPKPPVVIARRELRVDAEEALLLSMCIQVLRHDQPLPSRDPGPRAPATERLAWALKRIVPALVQEQEHHDRYRKTA